MSNPDKAKKVLDEGFAAGVLGKDPEAERHQRLLALATQRANEAAATLQKAEAGAAADKDGAALVRIGLAYTGMGQYDKGIALMQQGIAKGGLKRPHDANLHLGIALARAGQKGRAAQALKSVGGNDGPADLARLWMRVPQFRDSGSRPVSDRPSSVRRKQAARFLPRCRRSTRRDRGTPRVQENGLRGWKRILKRVPTNGTEFAHGRKRPADGRPRARQ